MVPVRRTYEPGSPTNSLRPKRPRGPSARRPSRRPGTIPVAPGTSIGMRGARPSPSSSLRGGPVGREQLQRDVLDDALLRHGRFDQAAFVDVLGEVAFRRVAG